MKNEGKKDRMEKDYNLDNIINGIESIKSYFNSNTISNKELIKELDVIIELLNTRVEMVKNGSLDNFKNVEKDLLEKIDMVRMMISIAFVGPFGSYNNDNGFFKINNFEFGNDSEMSFSIISKIKAIYEMLFNISKAIKEDTEIIYGSTLLKLNKKEGSK